MLSDHSRVYLVDSIVRCPLVPSGRHLFYEICSIINLYVTFQYRKHKNTVAEVDLNPPSRNLIKQRQSCLFCSFAVFLAVAICIAVRQRW
jgi:hypothetical protein